MVFSRSDRLTLGVLLALVLVGAGVGYLVSPSHHLQGTLKPEGTLDLNNASFDELLRLPGIGPTLAGRIIRYREEHGPFHSLEELLNVKGIGPTLLERLKERLVVAGPRQQGAPAITVERLCAWFGVQQVLYDIDLEIPARRVTAIIGPSGCGKTTFLRCLNRLHELAPGARVSGRVLLRGEGIYGRGIDPVLVRRRIGMVFQKPNPFPTMSIYDNVAAGLRLNGVRRRSLLDEAVERSLRQAALWEEVKGKLRRSGASLSGGQQQRLCIARALAVEPEVLLMDEPASALDPLATARIEDLIHELKSYVTIVIVTHNMQQAARVSDYTAFLYLGHLVEFGPTEQIFEKPKRKETEDYITGRFG